MNDVLENIITRRSIRSYHPEQIGEEELNTILLAGSYAPNEMGTQTAHSLGIGSCWLNQLPRLTHMPLIRELLTELDIPENHIVYGSVVLGYPAEEPKPAELRKDVMNIIR